MKKIVCIFLVFILLQLTIIKTTVFAAEGLSDELNDVTLSESEVLNTFYKDTQTRIDDIHNTNGAIQPSNGGNSYYVSNRGNDNNNGLSPEEPIATISAVNRLNLKAGDVVYFERGGVWRGTVKAYTHGVSFSAYGEGNKPELYASSHNYAEAGEWTETDAPDIYKYSEPIESDVGNIIFNNGEATGIKCVLEDKDGETYNKTTGKRFDSYADLTENLHFFHDSGATKELYLYCAGGNPADLYDSIEFAEREYIIDVGLSNDITIDNITFRYSGIIAVNAAFCENLTVKNCEFYWIGGSIQGTGKVASTRCGNGVQIWGSAKNFNIDNCYFTQIYDAAVTFQFQDDPSLEIHCDNINFTNNVMEYCNYSVEYFLDYGKDNANDFKNFTISGNHMWYAGYGFCSQRPDKNEDAHIKSWKHANQNNGNFVVSNNLFAIAKTYISETYSMYDNQGAEYDSNTYIQFINRYLGRNDHTDCFSRFTRKVRTEILQSFGDENARIIWVNNLVNVSEEPTDMIYGDADGNDIINMRDSLLLCQYLLGISSMPNERLKITDVNEDGITSLADAICIQKFVIHFESDCGVTGDAYQSTTPTQPEAYPLYFKTNLSWVTNGDVSLYAYDLNTEKSYRLEQVSYVYPYVYKAEVPGTLTDVSIYRFTCVVDDPPVAVSDDGGNVYNCWDTTVSSVKNCISLSDEAVLSTEAYSEEPESAFSLSTVYFDNSNAKWSDVYIYGWAASGLDGESVLMTHIDGTNIWYYTFDSPLKPGAECFLFKDTKNTWQNQTDNIIIQENLNCYLANEGSKTGGSWYYYIEE